MINMADCLTDLTLTLKITSTQVVETSVATNNSSSQNYTIPDDQPTTKLDVLMKYYLFNTKGFFQRNV